MNLALPALLLFFLALPGIVAYKGYKTAYVNSPTPASLTSETAYGLALAVVFHLIWGSVAQLVSQVILDSGIDLSSIIFLIGGDYRANPTQFRVAIEAVSRHPYMIAAYNFPLIAGSYFVGKRLSREVKARNWEVKYEFFKHPNDLYYLLKGIYFGIDEKSSNIDLVYASVLVDIKEEAILYRGIVYDFSFNRENDLERLLLIGAHRRSFSEDARGNDRSDRDPAAVANEDRYYSLEGDVFAINGENIKNINTEAIRLIELSNEGIKSILSDKEVEKFVT